MNRKLIQKAIRFHKDESGLSAVQWLMLLAVSSVALSLVVQNWPAVRNWILREANTTRGVRDWYVE